MKTVGAFEAKTHLSQILHEVESGQEVVIQRRGCSVAVLMPYTEKEKDDVEGRCRRVLGAFCEIRALGLPVESSDEIREMIDEGRKW